MSGGGNTPGFILTHSMSGGKVPRASTAAHRAFGETKSLQEAVPPSIPCGAKATTTSVCIAREGRDDVMYVSAVFP